MALRHKVSSEVVSTGVPDLDAMLAPGGFYRGTSVLMSGTAGMGKTSFASAFARSVCGRGERALYFAFEESPDQIARNMESIGIDLSPTSRAGGCGLSRSAHSSMASRCISFRCTKR